MSDLKEFLNYCKENDCPIQEEELTIGFTQENDYDNICKNCSKRGELNAGYFDEVGCVHHCIPYWLEMFYDAE